MTTAAIESSTLIISVEGFSILSKKLHTCPNKYEISKQYFELNCLTMLDFLKDYNLNGMVTKYLKFNYYMIQIV